MTTKTVPVEPTEEIIDAMVAAMTMASGYQYPKKLVIAAYKAALAAAPEQPTEPADEKDKP